MEADLCAQCFVEANTYCQEWFQWRPINTPNGNSYRQLVHRHKHNRLINHNDPEYLVFLDLIYRVKSEHQSDRGVRVWLTDREKYLLMPGFRIEDSERSGDFWHLSNEEKTDGSSRLFRFREKWWLDDGDLGISTDSNDNNANKEHSIALFLDQHTRERESSAALRNLLRLGRFQPWTSSFHGEYPIEVISGLSIEQAENFARAFALDSKVILRMA